MLGMLAAQPMNLPQEDARRATVQGWVAIVFFALFYIPSFSFLSGSALRYLVYAFPIASLFFWLLLTPKNRLLVSTHFVMALGIYALLILISVLTANQVIDLQTWVSAFRPIFYLAAFIPLMRFDDNSAKAVVVMFALTTIALWFSGAGTTRGQLNFDESQGLLETGIAFPAGGLMIYFIARQKKWWAFWSFVLCFIAFKRIAFGAVLVILMLMVFNRLAARRFGVNEYKLALASTGAMLLFAVLINVFYYDFFSGTAELLGIDKSVDTLTMGRIKEFGILYGQYGDQSLWHVLFGNGPGDARRKLVEVTVTYPLQVHNSYLLYFYDFGVVGFALLLSAFFVIFSRSVFGLYLLAYNFIIMVTDNTFVHHYHQVTYFVLIGAMQQENLRQKMASLVERERDAV